MTRDHIQWVISKIRHLFAVFSVVLSVSLAETALAEPIRIVAFGDSLSAGYQLPPGASFPERLEQALKAKNHDVIVVNAGVSGDTSTGGLARLDWTLGEGVDLVIVELGANDALRGIVPEETLKALDSILLRLKERGIKVLLAGMQAPPNMGMDFAGRFNPIYSTLAKKHQISLYPFFLDGVAGEPTLNLDDGMHPNAAGIDRIVAGIGPMVEDLIAAKP